MDFFYGKKISKFIILTLVLLNIILLGSFWLKNNNKTKDIYKENNSNINQNRTIREHRPNIRPGIRMFLKDKFGFNKKQIIKFKNLRDKHFIYAEKIKTEIEQIRKEMMEMLLEKDIDENLVRNLSLKIGAKMAEHERLVFSHFQELLKISDDKQLEEYKYFILGMLDKRKIRRDSPVKREHPYQNGNTVNPEYRTTLRERNKSFRGENRVDHLKRKLNLSEDQVVVIRKILEDELNKYPHKDYRIPSMEHHRRMLQQDREIEKILNDEQVKKFIALKKERRKRD